MNDETFISSGPPIPLDCVRPRALIGDRNRTASAMEVNRMAELTAAEKKICASLGIAPEAFRAQRTRETSGNGTTFAAAREPMLPGLARAHDEIDRADVADLANRGNSRSQWFDAPAPDLIAAAISGLRAFDPNAGQPGENKTYDRLLDGCLAAMRALDLSAPAYANRTPRPGEKR